MKMIMIENDGEVDVLAFTLMGASSKRNQSGKIGFFGSGNKYAVANLMRRNIVFRIFSGSSEIEVNSDPVTHREKKFDRIYFLKDGEKFETSLTTDMGPKWEPWYILRELYCNAVDEGNAKTTLIDSEEAPAGVSGKTRVYIELVDELFDVINHWNAYFTNERKDLIEHIGSSTKDFEMISECKIYHKYDEKFRIYRKGVLVYCGDEKSVFDYDLYNAEINEERILSNIYDAKRKLGISLASSGSSTLIKKIVTGIDKNQRNNFSCAEGGMYMHYYLKSNKENWKKAFDGLTVVNNDRKESYKEELQDSSSILLPGEIAYALAEVEGIARIMGVPSKGLKHSFRESLITQEQQYIIDKAFEFLVTAGFNFGDIKIQPVTFDDYAISGMADLEGNRIFVGQNCYDKGIKYTVTVLMEELAHIESRMFDETRAFQNFLIDKWLCAIEDKMDIRL